MDQHVFSNYKELARPLSQVSAVMSRIKGNDLRFDHEGKDISMVHLKMLRSNEGAETFFILGIDRGGNTYLLDLGERHGEEGWVHVAGNDQGVTSEEISS